MMIEEERACGECIENGSICWVGSEGWEAGFGVSGKGVVVSCMGVEIGVGCAAWIVQLVVRIY